MNVPLLADITISDTGVWTLVGLLLGELGSIFGWLLKIDRRVTDISATLDAKRDSIASVRHASLLQFRELWTAHREDVKDLGEIGGRLSAVEAKLETVLTDRHRP